MILCPFAVVIGTILFCSEKCRIDWSRTPDQWLVFDEIADLINGSLNGVKYSVDLKVQSEFSERTESVCLL